LPQLGRGVKFDHKLKQVYHNLHLVRKSESRQQIRQKCPADSSLTELLTLGATLLPRQIRYHLTCQFFHFQRNEELFLAYLHSLSRRRLTHHQSSVNLT